MASIRHHTHIDRPADEVWKVVADAGSIADWASVIEESSAEGSRRTCSMGGTRLVEEIVTSDDELRRFQYRIVEGVPVDHHLATVDVLEDGDGALLIYSADIEPDALGDGFDQATAGLVQDLRRHLEG